MPPWTKPPPEETLLPPAVEFGPPPPVVDPAPWIGAILPPSEDKEDSPVVPPEVVIQPVEILPIIMPPPPDLTPPSIVPPEAEDSMPPMEPDAPTPESGGGGVAESKPPPTVIVLGPGSVIGTFMVYVGAKLVLSMAASAGTQGGKELTRMLVGALNKRMRRGTSVRFNTGKSPGVLPEYWQARVSSAVSYSDAWRMVPQECSYWEA